MKVSVFFFASASTWHSVHGKQESSLVQCEGNTVGWVNSYGNGCDWYEVNDLPGCPKFGPNWDGGMGVADLNCCFCAGTGAPSPPTPAQHPTNHPTVTQVPTMSAAPSVCTGNTVGWVDVSGDGCDWYEGYDSVGCPYYGHLYDGGMGVANDNCCFCERTGAPIFPTPTSPPVPYLTYHPTVTQVPTMSAAPSVCTGNTAGWVDEFGDGCDWYESVDSPGCPYYGHLYDGGMGVANENCCFCAGTGAPTPPVPTWPPLTTFPTYPPGQLPTYHPTPTDQIGLCGYGRTGNGVCAKPKACCSIFGWCGYGDDYCGVYQFVPKPTASPTVTGQPSFSAKPTIGDNDDETI